MKSQNSVNNKDILGNGYRVFDGSYFYEPYYLLNKFNEKLIEYSVEEYFENNELVELPLFIERLEQENFGEVVLYQHDTTYNRKESRYSVDWYLFIKDEQVILNIDHDTVKDLSRVQFRPRSLMSIESVGMETLASIFEVARSCVVEVEDDRKRYISIVSSAPREGLRLNRHEIRKPAIKNLDLYYGKGFESKHERFLNILQEKDRSGLFIFHGETGSGKTNYIRYLINQAPIEMNFIFYPITMLRELTNPQLITFISDYQNAVLVIEESEDTVQARDTFGSDKTSIANLLNITDGLLSDVLNLKIISTFNTDINNLDKALLREGRLLGIHRFGKLSAEDANQIAEANQLDKKFSEPATLAQIFNKPLRSDLSDFVSNDKRIGFR